MKTHLKSCGKQPKIAPIYRPKKYSRCRAYQLLMLLSVDRPVDLPTVKFLTVATCQSTARSTVPRFRPPVDRPVDRGQIRSTGLLASWPCTFCAHRSTTQSTDFWLGQPAGRLPDSLVSKCLGLKTWSFYLQ